MAAGYHDSQIIVLVSYILCISTEIWWYPLSWALQLTLYNTLLYPIIIVHTHTHTHTHTHRVVLPGDSYTYILHTQWRV